TYRFFDSGSKWLSVVVMFSLSLVLAYLRKAKSIALANDIATANLSGPLTRMGRPDAIQGSADQPRDRQESGERRRLGREHVGDTRRCEGCNRQKADNEDTHWMLLW